MEKLFYKDVHKTDFQATVSGCLRDEKSGHYLVTLDRTAFFPEEGGQLADKGTLDGQEVLDVQIKNDVIYHAVAQEIPAGRTLEGHVDWEQRFDFMQQHSGEHIVSGLVHSRYGYDNVGFHLGLSDVTLDFNGSLSLEQLREIEKEANNAVWRNLPILVTFPDQETLSRLEYRSKLELTKDVRIVEIPGVDTCACCAPHVDSTGQIGLIKVTSVQSHRGGVRVTILCGRRALADYTQKQDSVSAISSLLSAKQHQVADAVARLLTENANRKERTNKLQADLLALEMKRLPEPDVSPNVLLFVDDLDTIAMRNAVNSLVDRYPGFCGIFAGNDGEGYRFIIGSSCQDCKQLAERLRQDFQAKGGGTAPMIQGSMTASAEAIRSFFQ